MAKAVAPLQGAPLDLNAVRELLAHAQRVSGDWTRFRASYLGQPVRFADEVLGISLWDKQRAIVEAPLRHRQVAVRSGHGVGKTISAAVLTLYWLYCEHGLVVTTAPTKQNVEDVLWRTIHELLERAPVRLPGERSKTELKLTPALYACGITAESDTAFQGRHHPRLLVIADEAPGVPEPIHLALSTLTTGANNCLLLIGNPTAASGTFYECFRTPQHWHLMSVSCFEHPNVVAGREDIQGAVTRPWIEERRAKWGEHHPFWYSRVLGEFPKISTRGVVPLGWVERAQDAAKWSAAVAAAEEAREPKIGGLDVARYGDNRCVLVVRQGDAVLSIESWAHTSLAETAGIARRAINEKGLKVLVIDAAGIGAGVYDILEAQNLENIYAFNGGHRAFTPGSFSSRRSELWWHLRQRFEKERLWLAPAEPELGQLVSDLVAPEYEIAMTGRLKVETKEQLLERGVPSPDYADALCYSFATEADPEAVFAEKPAEGRDVLGDTFVSPPDALEEAPFDQMPWGF